MNQRAGKKHAAALIDNDRITLKDVVRFFEEAAELLQTDSDERFYFEQCAEHFRSNPKGFHEKTSRILGV